ncbi:acetyl-CoA acetyltransferase [Pokkaliibacter plantistimulans]|uniref:Acetyl-CoA acetyltransferase n=1 Tax=Pokkaliibacter plantistimulans TaxID=1635171 RepID=A0ABX5LX58_9GAMM|nr:acetyl-CoA C-acyltransferase [Pokkaliibacter plantistimulans]PXF29886.1 acetyl-CoA acetyltransferase [Pokkaliibacter plantistimulans]
MSSTEHINPTTDIVVVAASRTPMGGFQGSLSSLKATELGSVAIRHALQASGLPAEVVDEVVMGCVLPAGLGQAPARQASRGAGLPDHVGCTTVNKMCGSGMKAVMMAMDQIRAGEARIMVAGGMESMSNAPYLLPKARAGLRMGHQQVIDHMFFDGLEDAYEGGLMGVFAQQAADRFQVTREEMDAFAINSLRKAQTATEQGWLNSEMAPVSIQSRKGEEQVTQDEQPFKANIDKIPTLKPAFARDGSVTAANSSSISDGASALLLMSAAEAEQRGLQPLARLLAHSTHAQLPAEFTLAPIGAIDKVLKKAGWDKSSVDLFEINEAFAVVTMLAIRQLELDESRVNIFGGACAQGHPIGSSGSRILVTLIHALRQKGLKRGIASLCIGGGEATAVAVEVL